jgi:hypothetical protein
MGPAGTLAAMCRYGPEGKLSPAGTPRSQRSVSQDTDLRQLWFTAKRRLVQRRRLARHVRPGYQACTFVAGQLTPAGAPAGARCRGSPPAARLPRLVARGYPAAVPDVTVREFFLRRIRAGGKACGRSIHDLDRCSPLHVLSCAFISPRRASSGGFRDRREEPEMSGDRLSKGSTAAREPARSCAARDRKLTAYGEPIAPPTGVIQRVAAGTTAGSLAARASARSRIRGRPGGRRRGLRRARVPPLRPPPDRVAMTRQAPRSPPVAMTSSEPEELPIITS